MTAGDKAINYISMFIGGAVGLAVGLVIYRRTMARAAELAREEGLDSAALSVEEGLGGYEDERDSPLMDPEDAAVLMSDDDISLWDRPDDEGRYYDDDDEDAGHESGNKRRD